MARQALVVHEEPLLRALLRRLIEREGIAVREAAGASDALALLAADPDGVAAVVCGGRVSGPPIGEFAAGLLAVAPRARVSVFTSAPPDPATLPPGVRVFPKPAGLADLVAAVRAAAG